jgi:hypothetical protein
VWFEEEIMEHHLKSWPCFFEALWNGSKNFEVRVNDRGFLVGDMLHLEEWDPKTGKYSGRVIIRRVTYMTTLEDLPTKPLLRGYVIMCLAKDIDGA